MIRTNKPSEQQKNEVEKLARQIGELIVQTEDQGVIAVALANVVSNWLMAHHCVGDQRASIALRGRLFERFVKDVGAIVDWRLQQETQIGHA